MSCVHNGEHETCINELCKNNRPVVHHLHLLYNDDEAKYEDKTLETWVDNNTRIRRNPISSCTMHGAMVSQPRDELGLEKNVSPVTLDDLYSLPATARFGNHLGEAFIPDLAQKNRFKFSCGKKEMDDDDRGSRDHLCIEEGRRTVVGNLLLFLWVFNDLAESGHEKRCHLIYSRDDVIRYAYMALRERIRIGRVSGSGWGYDDEFIMWTRHGELSGPPELLVPFCLPFQLV